MKRGASEPGSAQVRRSAGVASALSNRELQEPGSTHDELNELKSRVRGANLEVRIQIEREGVPAEAIKAIIQRVGLNAKAMQEVVRVPKATFGKKLRAGKRFSGVAGQAVLGLVDLINIVEKILGANPAGGAECFDAEAWVGHWIQRPNSALDGIRPAELLDTPSGRDAVMRAVSVAAHLG